MSITDEPIECPLCMEPLEIDDISFYPCTCGYQICRFCWHRIRTDENGLCPACRKQYPEDPAEFKPLTEDELVRIKKERRQKDSQRKQKAAENRKHLANVRVVQKNLVFVVGLTPRLADQDLLKKHEYFGKFGKIHKVVINQSTTYAGSQGPSSSAYLTYIKSEDALKAIQAVNNAYVDGRTLKASLGTTKYCSHFLKGTQCQKSDCMYLHELGEKAASFTKEEMQLGKHQDYEQKLIEDYLNHQNMVHHSAKAGHNTQPQNISRKGSSPPTIPLSESPCSSASGTNGTTSVVNACRESWPSLQQTQLHNATQSGQPLGVRTDWSNTNGDPPKNSPPSKPQTTTNNTVPPHQPPTTTQQQPAQTTTATDSTQHRKNSDTLLHSPVGDDRCSPASTSSSASSTPAPGAPPSLPPAPSQAPPAPTHKAGTPPVSGKAAPAGAPVPGSSSAPVVAPGQSYSGLQLGPNNKPLFPITPENSLSLFSDNGFPRDRQRKQNVPPLIPDEVQRTEVPDQIPASTSTDWQAAFGFPSSAPSSSSSSSSNVPPIIDDDLGFDPWDESSKALADLIQRETQSSPLGHPMGRSMAAPPPPPGFHNPTHFLPKSDFGGLGQSKMAFMAGFNQQQQQTGSRPPGFVPPSAQNPAGQKPVYPPHNGPTDHAQITHQNDDIFTMKEWQEGLRALLPNINISFGSSPYPGNNNNPLPRSAPQPIVNNRGSAWPGQTPALRNSLTTQDPAILTSGHRTSANGLSESPPHWMRSLQQLTDLDASAAQVNQPQAHSRLPFVRNFTNTGLWPTAGQTQAPPPGFRPNHMPPEPRLAADYQ